MVFLISYISNNYQFIEKQILLNNAPQDALASSIPYRRAPPSVVALALALSLVLAMLQFLLSLLALTLVFLEEVSLVQAEESMVMVHDF
jgi:hypothetical protein